MASERETLLLADIRRLESELSAARDALTEERFRDVPRLPIGRVVLVPRKLFGKVKWWPAQIAAVHLDYSAGTDPHGNPWENHAVSYSVYLQSADGDSFGGSSHGFYASEILDYPR